MKALTSGAIAVSRNTLASGQFGLPGYMPSCYLPLLFGRAWLAYHGKPARTNPPPRSARPAVPSAALPDENLP
ncbi:MAG: hypothetical protein Kow0026_06030 [Oricola sp.]